MHHNLQSSPAESGDRPERFRGGKSELHRAGWSAKVDCPEVKSGVRKVPQKIHRPVPAFSAEFGVRGKGEKAW